MNNEPVAWISPSKNLYHSRMEAVANGEQTVSPLYTHPVNTCKHGVDDGACKECYMESTHPIKDINEAIEIIKDFQNSDVPPCKDYENTYADGWMDACNEILWAIEEKAQEK